MDYPPFYFDIGLRLHKRTNSHLSHPDRKNVEEEFPFLKHFAKFIF